MPSFTSPRALISASDIARLAQINRATISNWRRRGVGFPEPAGGENSRPLFDLDQVVSWLTNRGIVIYPDILDVPQGSRSTNSGATTSRDSEPRDSDFKSRGRGKRGGRGRSRQHGDRRCEDSGEMRGQRPSERRDARRKERNAELNDQRRGEPQGTRRGYAAHGNQDGDLHGHSRGRGRGLGGPRGSRHDSPEIDATLRAEAQLRGAFSTYQSRRLLIELLAYVAMERRGELAGAPTQPIMVRSQATAHELVRGNPALALMFEDLVIALNKPGVLEIAEHIVSTYRDCENLERIARKVSRKMSHDRFGAPQFAANPAVAKMLTNLVKGVGDIDSRAVLGCGTGSVVARLSRERGTVIGFDNAPEAAEIAAARLAIAGVAGKIEVRDLLTHPPLDQKFSVVICDTPFGMRTPADLSARLAESYGSPLRTSEGYFLSLTQQMLTDEGYGVIVLPASYWYGAQENRELVKSGVVEAVIELPAHIMPVHEGRSVVVVLRGAAQVPQDPQTLYIQVPQPDAAGHGSDSFRGGPRGPRRMSGLGRHDTQRVARIVADFRADPHAKKRLKRGGKDLRSHVQSSTLGLVDPRAAFHTAFRKRATRSAQDALVQVNGTLNGLSALDLDDLTTRVEAVAESIKNGRQNVQGASAVTLRGLGVEVGKTSFERPLNVGDLLLLGPRGPHRQPRFVYVNQELKERLEAVLTREVSSQDRPDSRGHGGGSWREQRQGPRGRQRSRGAQIVVRTSSLETDHAQFIGHVLNSGETLERIASKLERFTPDAHGGRGKALIDAIAETTIPQLPASNLDQVAQVLNDLEMLRSLGDKLSKFAKVTAQEITSEIVNR